MNEQDILILIGVVDVAVLIVFIVIKIGMCMVKRMDFEAIAGTIEPPPEDVWKCRICGSVVRTRSGEGNVVWIDCEQCGWSLHSLAVGEDHQAHIRSILEHGLWVRATDQQKEPK